MDNLKSILTGLPETITLITSAVTVILLVVKQLNENRKAKSERAKEEAEAADIISGTAITLVSPLNQRIAQLERELKKAQKYIRILIKQIKAAGLVPAEQPNGDE